MADTEQTIKDEEQEPDIEAGIDAEEDEDETDDYVDYAELEGDEPVELEESDEEGDEPPPDWYDSEAHEDEERMEDVTVEGGPEEGVS